MEVTELKEFERIDQILESMVNELQRISLAEPTRNETKDIERLMREIDSIRQRGRMQVLTADYM